MTKKKKKAASSKKSGAVKNDKKEEGKPIMDFQEALKIIIEKGVDKEKKN